MIYFTGLVITFLIIEYLGRKKTMAVEFIVFSLFVMLVNICLSRYVNKTEINTQR